MDANIAISLKNVSKYYKLYDEPKARLKEALSGSSKIYHKKFYATKELDLEIQKGEIIGIVGQNGSGKSTLLKLITKVLVPDEGKIEVNGKISALLELGSGFNPEFTGLQNIYFYGTILGFSKKEMDAKIEDIINFAELGEFINQPIKTYSSGMKSRLGFAVAIHVDPDILILDEVLSVGDIHFKRKCYGKMEEFFESGKTIIYVSHSSGEVNRLCTRAVMLHDGSIIMDGEPKEVTKYYEKFLFASKDNKEKVLKELATHQNSSDNETILDVKKLKSIKKNTKNKSRNIQESYFIKDFFSKNKVEYDNTFLKIDNIHIETLSGKEVNVLIVGERYVFSYRLNFEKNFQNVDFGMQILNEKGVLISGAKNEKSLDFQSGENIEIRWEFDCLMHQGIYYTSIGVNYLNLGAREYINRVNDAMVFKVLPVKNFSNGLVYLNQSAPEIRKNSE